MKTEEETETMHAVTGAFGYSGKYIAERLLSEGKTVITLTNSVHRKNPFGHRLRAMPFHFDEPEKGQQTMDVIINAIGPETFTYRGLAETIGEIIGKRRPIVSVPPRVGHAVGWILGKLVGDVMITREEIKGLMDDLLWVDAPPTGTTKLTDWAKGRATRLGLHYTGELARRRDRETEYKSN